jgi:hypothetical protein
VLLSILLAIIALLTFSVAANTDFGSLLTNSKGLLASWLPPNSGIKRSIKAKNTDRIMMQI